MARNNTRYPGMKYLLPTAGIFLSVLLAWFAVLQYRKAFPIAAENLRGLALTLSAAIEALAEKDPSLVSLKTFHAGDIAYFSVLEPDGTVLFHSNRALVGTRVKDGRFAPVFSGSGFSEARTRLGTGEEVYESNTPIHFSGSMAALRIALHTYRADAVIRGARANMLVLLGLLAVAWVLGAVLYRLYLRSERLRAEMTRRERLARLGEMGAALAHEIRNPLAGIKGYAQLLQENRPPSAVAGPAALIVEESLRLERLVDELLCFVRPASAPGVRVRPAMVIRRSLDVVGPEAARRGVTVVSELRDDPELTGDADGLEQVFINLLRNSLQAMPGGGEVEVRLTDGGGEARIEIRDTGHGIAEGEWERIFEPFHTTRARGTGLGLAICRKIVEDHGGSVRVSESSDKGTTLLVTLPLFRESGNFA